MSSSIIATQLIPPNPDIRGREGMCLEYVRKTFGLPARYGSATEAWNNSTTQHPGRDMPAGVWVPIWYELDSNPNGHVALLAPDGSVYSTSDLDPHPVHHHNTVADLEFYYAYYNQPLTWRGWTEDVAGTLVIQLDQHTTAEGDDMFTDDDRAVLNSANIRADTARSEATNAKLAAQECQVAIKALATATGATIDYAAIAKAVADEEARRMAG